MKYYNDENFLRLVSQKMGGVPQEMKKAMMSLHECVRYVVLPNVHRSACWCIQVADAGE